MPILYKKNLLKYLLYLKPVKSVTPVDHSIFQTASYWSMFLIYMYFEIITLSVQHQLWLHAIHLKDQGHLLPTARKELGPSKSSNFIRWILVSSINIFLFHISHTTNSLPSVLVSHCCYSSSLSRYEFISLLSPRSKSFLLPYPKRLLSLNHTKSSSLKQPSILEWGSCPYPCALIFMNWRTRQSLELEMTEAQERICFNVHFVSDVLSLYLLQSWEMDTSLVQFTAQFLMVTHTKVKAKMLLVWFVTTFGLFYTAEGQELHCIPRRRSKGWRNHFGDTQCFKFQQENKRREKQKGQWHLWFDRALGSSHIFSYSHNTNFSHSFIQITNQICLLAQLPQRQILMFELPKKTQNKAHTACTHCTWYT